LNTTANGVISEGGLDSEQLLWIAAELERAVADRVLVIVLSHHLSGSIVNGGEHRVKLGDGAVGDKSLYSVYHIVVANLFYCGGAKAGRTI
jgi:hypothetical protein